jgi:hypothetical protein
VEQLGELDDIEEIKGAKEKRQEKFQTCNNFRRKKVDKLYRTQQISKKQILGKLAEKIKAPCLFEKAALAMAMASSHLFLSLQHLKGSN